LDAGSVLTSSTFLPASAKVTATAHEDNVLPTPPLPVKKRLFGGVSRNFIASFQPQQEYFGAHPES